MEPGSQCGFQAAPTYDELMISVFEHEPLWMDYQRSNANTVNTRSLYKKFFTTFPAGFITQPIRYNGASIETPMKKLISDSKYQ